MKLGRSTYHQQIIDYYDNCEVSYRDIWDLENSMAIHFGFWDEKTNNLTQALLRMNEILSEKAEVKESDHILDAGCGVGGSSIYLAKQFRCKVTGITLSEKQVSSATKNAETHGVSNLTTFQIRDFLNTGFPDNTFDVVWAIESVCHAESKSEFAKEAFRILKKGGRLIIADGFLAKESNESKTIEMFEKWLSAWAVSGIETMSNFNHSLENKGFTNCSISIVSKNVMRSSRRLYILANFALFYGTFLSLVGRKYGNAHTKNNAEGAVIQYKLLKKGLWEYCHVYCEK